MRWRPLQTLMEVVSLTDTREFPAAGLTLHVEHRTFGDDGGPALRVLADVDGIQCELLRFDCFRKNPHYHYDPNGRDEVHPLDASNDPVGWTIRAVRTDLAEMIRHAGYPTVADAVDESAVQRAIEEIEAQIR